MLETMVERQVIFYIAGIVAAVGVLARVTAGISMRRLVRAAGNMNKSGHGLMRLVRAKFEHACMVSDKVQNVRAFVEKYLYEYKVLGMRLHTWRRIERATIWIYGALVLAGAGAAYQVQGEALLLLPYAVAEAAGVLVLLFLYLSMDEKYQMEAAKMYMVDFLENTYAHRYEKSRQKEIQVRVQRNDREPRREETLELELEELGEPEELEVMEEEDQPRETVQPEPERTVQQTVPPAAEEPEPGPAVVEAVKTVVPAGEGAAEEKSELPKEARIREILEEFLA